jgi:hypothetical protein
MADSGYRNTIIVALIGVIGTLGAALIGNWDKIFAPARPAPGESRPAPDARPVAQSESTASVEPTRPARPEPRAAAPPAPVPSSASIGGVWRDSDNPANGSQVVVEGNAFRFTRWGVLPNGVRFDAQGNGTLSGHRFSSTYRARYQSGDTSTGACSGAVSADGARMDMSCRDSLLGSFPVTALRQ